MHALPVLTVNYLAIDLILNTVMQFTFHVPSFRILSFFGNYKFNEFLIASISLQFCVNCIRIRLQSWAIVN